jgi:hypothetical protein
MPSQRPPGNQSRHVVSAPREIPALKEVVAIQAFNGDEVVSSQAYQSLDEGRRKMKQAIVVFLISSAVLLIFTIAQPAQAQTFNTQLNITLLNLLPPPTTTDPPGNFHHVQPADFDPGKTYLVQATWLSGLGCPTNAFILDFTTGTTMSALRTRRAPMRLGILTQMTTTTRVCY